MERKEKKRKGEDGVSTGSVAFGVADSSRDLILERKRNRIENEKRQDMATKKEDSVLKGQQGKERGVCVYIYMCLCACVLVCLCVL
jgi:hypothetical protein